MYQNGYKNSPPILSMFITPCFWNTSQWLQQATPPNGWIFFWQRNDWGFWCWSIATLAPPHCLYIVLGWHWWGWQPGYDTVECSNPQTEISNSTTIWAQYGARFNFKKIYVSCKESSKSPVLQSFSFSFLSFLSFFNLRVPSLWRFSMVRLIFNDTLKAPFSLRWLYFLSNFLSHRKGKLITCWTILACPVRNAVSSVWVNSIQSQLVANQSRCVFYPS